MLVRIARRMLADRVSFAEAFDLVLADLERDLEVALALARHDALETSLRRVLEWPLPGEGTVETCAIPAWLAAEARAALGLDPEKRT